MGETADLLEQTLSPEGRKAAAALQTLAEVDPKDVRAAYEFVISKGRPGVDLALGDRLRGLTDGVEHGA